MSESTTMHDLSAQELQTLATKAIDAKATAYCMHGHFLLLSLPPSASCPKFKFCYSGSSINPPKSPSSIVFLYFLLKSRSFLMCHSVSNYIQPGFLFGLARLDRV